MPVYVVVLILGLYFMENWFYLMPEEGYPMIGDTVLCCNKGDNSNSLNLWTNTLYINNFLPSDKQYMLWTWSLAIEEQFYLFAPLLLTFVLKKPKNKIYTFLNLFVLSLVICFIAVYLYELFPNNY